MALGLTLLTALSIVHVLLQAAEVNLVTQAKNHQPRFRQYLPMQAYWDNFA